MFMAPVSLPTYTKLLARAGFAEIGTEDWSSRVSPTYDRWSKYLPQDPDQRPNAAERVESIICVFADLLFPAIFRNRFSHVPRRAQRTKV
jgi:hypothetical protein